MRPPSRKHVDREARADTAMTPMIDVVFLLLVFFVCASIGHEVDQLLPTPLSGDGVAATPIDPDDLPLGSVEIEVTRAGGRTIATVQGRSHENLAALDAQLVALANVAPEIPVILDVADDVPMQDVLRIVDTGRDAGFRTVQFAIGGT